MSVLKRVKAGAMAAAVVFTVGLMTGCQNGLTEDELRSIIAEMNTGSDNNSGGNSGSNDYDSGSNDYNFGSNSYDSVSSYDFGGADADVHYQGNAAAGNHQYEESTYDEQSDGLQPGTAIVEWNGVQYNAVASYENNDKCFAIRASFDGKYIGMAIYKDKVSEGDKLEDANGDFDYANKIGLVSLVDFPTTNGTVYNGGTNVSTMYDLQYFDGVTLEVKKYDPNGVTEFLCVAWVDMGDYGNNIFEVSAAVDVNTSQSYGSSGSSNSNTGGGFAYGSDKCGYCNGVGTCQVCGGLRKIYVPSYTGGEGTYVYCSSCNGNGKCEWCGGTGKR